MKNYQLSIQNLYFSTNKKTMMHQFFKSILIFPILIVLMTTACQNNSIPTQPFKHDNVTFELPEDWVNSEQDSSDDGYYLATFDHSSKQKSNFVFLEWNKGLISLDTAMTAARTGFLSEPTFQELKLKFTAVKDTTFAGQKCLQSQYNYEQVGIKYEGKIFTFQMPDANKTLILTVQYAKVDEPEVQPIIKSLDKTIQAVPIS